MKRFLTLFVTLMLVLCMFAGAAYADGEVRTVSMLIGSDGTMDGLNAVIAAAEEKLGIRVELELHVSGPDGVALVKARLASGDMSDILCYNCGALLKAINPAEHFVALNDYEWIDRLDDTFRETASVDGMVYGVPYSSSSAGGVLYNKAMYEQYGLSVPTTWDEFLANLQVLQDAGETAIIGTCGTKWTSQVLFLGDYYNVLAGAPNFGVEFEAGTAKYSNTPSAKRSFEKYADIGQFYNEDFLTATYDDGCEWIAEGQAGHWMVLTSALSNIYSLYDKETVDNIGIFGIPGDDAENSGLTVWMPSALYANKDSENLDAVLEFMEYYISDEALDIFTANQLPDGPYCIKGYEMPDAAFAAVAEDMQSYFDAGKTHVAQEYECSVKGTNCAAICIEVTSGELNAEEGASVYDDDCLKQAVQLGLNWEE